MMSEFELLVNKRMSRNRLSSPRRSIIDPDHLLLLLLLPLQSVSIAVAADLSTTVAAIAADTVQSQVSCFLLIRAHPSIFF